MIGQTFYHIQVDQADYLWPIKPGSYNLRLYIGVSGDIIHMQTLPVSLSFSFGNEESESWLGTTL